MGRCAVFNISKTYKRSQLIDIVSITTINCNLSLANQKQWLVYRINELTGQFEKQVTLTNNPTINYAELVLQPNTLDYGIYQIIYKVTMLNTGPTLYESQIDTFIKIVPSGLILSSLSQSQPMYGGTIEITRGLAQTIAFDPFLFSYDIDAVAVITSLTFKYYCQVIDNTIQSGYVTMPGSNFKIDLLTFKANNSLNALMNIDQTCFNTSGKGICFKSSICLVFIS